MEKPTNTNSEIDLYYIQAKIKKYATRINDSFFDAILFVKRYIVILLILLIAGIALGFYKDNTDNNFYYEHKIVVIPNFGSVDYLYGEVEKINATIGGANNSFFKSIGISDPKQLVSLKIEPVVDIYDFIDDIEPGTQYNRKFDMFKLLADNGDINKMLEDETTSKNYKNHVIIVSTRNTTSNNDVIEPLLNYFNSSPYYMQMQKEYVNNLEENIAANDTLIKQIDGILNSFSLRSSRGGSNVVSFNNDGQLNSVIETKNRLVIEQGRNRINKVNYNKIIKDSVVLLNIKKAGFTSGKMKIIIPILLLIGFIIVINFVRYYKSQKAKRNSLAQNI